MLRSVRPDGRGEAVWGVVHERDGLFVGGHGLDAHDGAERFFLNKTNKISV